MNAPTPPLVARDDVLAALGTVVDPEIGLDIVSLGLVYDVAVEERDVTVTMTLTTPGCPLEGVMRRGVAAAVGRLPGVASARVRIVWEPPWTPDMIAPRALRPA